MNCNAHVRAFPKFGVAGFPPAFWASEFKKDRIHGPEWLRMIGLDLLELQMTYGPRMKEENAQLFREKSEQFHVALTIHASYFIVLTSPDQKKVDRSFATLEKTCKLAQLCRATRIVLHPGSAETWRQPALERFVHNLTYFNRNSLPEDISLHPETAGKRNQIGSEDEILTICKEVPGCFPCLDFAHIRAFNRGGLSTAEEISASLEKVKKQLGAEAVRKTHIHVAPVEFGNGGEKRHRAYGEMEPMNPQSDMFEDTKCQKPFLPLPEHVSGALFSEALPCWVVSECYDSQEQGALAMKRRYEELSRN